MRVLSFVKKEKYREILSEAGRRGGASIDFVGDCAALPAAAERYNLVFAEICKDPDTVFFTVKQVLDRFPAVSIILLMQECRFEYSMRAMRMGVKNILIGEEINAETVCEVVRSYEKEFADETALRQENIRRIFEQLIFVHGDGQTNRNAMRLNEVFDLKGKGCCFFVFALTSLEFVLRQNESGAFDRKISSEKISLFLSSFASEGAAARFVFYLDDIFYVVITDLFQPSVRRMAQKMREVMSDFQGYAKPMLGEKTLLFSSACRTDFCDLKKSMAELEKLTLYSHGFPYPSAVLYSDLRISEPHSDTFEKLTQTAVRMFDSIERNNGYLDILNKLFSAENLKSLPAGQFRKFREYLHFEFEFLRKKADPSDRKAYQKKLDELLLPVNDLTVRDIVLSLAEMITGSAAGKYNYLITKCMQFISENYMSNIGLYEAAKKLEISTVYLSQLFKKEVGNNFNTYLNEYRLERAKELIDSGSYKLTRVCEMVGFNNLQYFSKCFKKAFNMTPNEYKNRRKSE